MISFGFEEITREGEVEELFESKKCHFRKRGVPDL